MENRILSIDTANAAAQINDTQYTLHTDAYLDPHLRAEQMRAAVEKLLKAHNPNYVVFVVPTLALHNIQYAVVANFVIYVWGDTRNYFFTGARCKNYSTLKKSHTHYYTDAGVNIVRAGLQKNIIEDDNKIGFDYCNDENTETLYN